MKPILKTACLRNCIQYSSCYINGLIILWLTYSGGTPKMPCKCHCGLVKGVPLLCTLGVLAQKTRSSMATATIAGRCTSACEVVAWRKIGRRAGHGWRQAGAL